jgi:hypothetical protein
MGDLIYVVIVIAFFALAAGLVRGCDLIVGPDHETVAADRGNPKVTDAADSSAGVGR